MGLDSKPELPVARALEAGRADLFAVLILEGEVFYFLRPFHEPR